MDDGPRGGEVGDQKESAARFYLVLCEQVPSEYSEPIPRGPRRGMRRALHLERT